MTLLDQPISFHPVFKQTLWGGRRLGTQLGKAIGEGSDYAESWEIVDHGDDQSVVCGGELDGQTLRDLVTRHGSLLMGDHAPTDSFPLLLKYLDCNRVLSVQVHPGDQYAGKLTIPDRGKTEAWYIVDAAPDALIYAGLQSGVDRQGFGEAIEAGQTEQVLSTFHPEPGDVVFIPAGTVHALGAGLLVAEIQQSSDTTFRLFDWNRLDAEGKSRPLHLKQGLEVTDYQSGPVSPIRSDGALAGWQRLVRCDNFELDVLRQGVTTVADSSGFEIITVPTGRATLRWGDQSRILSEGDSLLLPASMPPAEIELAQAGDARWAVLRARVPQSG